MNATARRTVRRTPTRAQSQDPAWHLGLALMMGVSFGCEGAIGSPEGSTPPGREPPVSCDVMDVGTSGVRRLDPDELSRTVADLLADPTLQLHLSDPAGDTITLLEVDELFGGASTVASSPAAEGVVACPSGRTGSECAAELIERFGRRAFRRPLRAEERTWLDGVYARAEASLGQADAMNVVLQVMLQAPQLLYVEEVGVADDALPAGIRRLDGYERATRLAYFLWGSTPDAALLDAAEAGALDDAAGVQAMAERMLEQPRAREQVVRFFVDWLELDGTVLHRSLEENPKSAERFPGDGPALRAAMRREVEALVERTFFEGDASLRTLLTTRDAYVDGGLAALYGLRPPADPDAFEWVELDPRERAGLFTRAAFLSLYSGADVQSPIRRGVFLLEDVIRCRPLGEPPPNANDTPVTGGVVDGRVLSVRDDVHARTVAAGGECAACHELINPVGYLFEHYDALGGFQLEERHIDDAGRELRLPVDATGQVPGSDIEGAVENAVELAERLAESRMVQNCMSDRWFEAALHRWPGRGDVCSARQAQDRFAETDNMRELVLGIVTSDAFLHVRPEEE